MAIARVQAGGSGATSGAATTIATTLAGVGVGNGLIVCISENVASVGAVSGVSDTHNTYTQAASIAKTDGTGFQHSDLWYCKSVGTGGSLTITATFAVSGGGLMTVIEVSGQDTVSFLDKAVSATGSSTAPNSGATAATTAANEFVVGFCGVRTSNAIATSPTFSTALTSQTTETLADNTLTADKGQLSTFDGLLASSGVTETFSATIVTNPWVAVCATFLPSAAVVPVLAQSRVVKQAIQRAAVW